MMLFTKEIDQKLFSQYKLGSDLENQVVVAKIFNPYGNGVWYLLNSDPEDPDYIWAIVDLFEVEVGSVSREELETLKVPPFRLGLERDMYFKPINAQKLYNSLLKGEKFADGGTIDIKKDKNGDNWVFPNNPEGEDYGIKLAGGGMTAGRWYKDNGGKEYRFIGESQGKLLFNDGEKIVEKDESDFEDEPKQSKFFGFFANGGKTPRTVKLTLSDKDSYDYTYKQDGATAAITFGFGAEPFTFEVKKISKSLEPLQQDILDTFTIQGIKQHEYKGGFSEAIKHLDTNILYSGEEFARGGVSRSAASAPLRDEELLKMYERLKAKKEDGYELDAHEEYALNKSEYLLKTKGLLKGDSKMAKGGDIYDDMNEDIDFSNKKAQYLIGVLKSSGYNPSNYQEADYDSDASIDVTPDVHINVSLEGEIAIVKDEGDGKFRFIDCGDSIATMLQKLKVYVEKKEKGGETEDEGVDLFEDYDNIPSNVQKILDKYSDAFEDGDYKNLGKAQKELQKIGYTFEYGLDGQAYDLRKIGQKGKNEDEFADGGRIKGRNNETGETYGVVIGSVKKSDEYKRGGTEMNVRRSYSNRISEEKLIFDANGNLYEVLDYGYGYDGNYPNTEGNASGHTYNADKKETLSILSKKYTPSFAKKLIESAKGSMAKGGYMADGGELDWGADLGDGFSVGNDVYITDSRSRFYDKNGYVVGKLGQSLVIRVGDDDMDAVINKKYVQRLEAPEFSKGGRTRFKDKVESIKASLLKRKKVSPKVQKDYGKTYSPKEAEESAKRIVGSMVKNEKRQSRVSKKLEKMKKGSSIKKKKSTFKDRMKELSNKIKETKSKSSK